MDERVESILGYLHERGVIEEVLNEASEGAKAPPPASKRAVLQLPTITVAVEDLQDESNRTCCICLEINCPGESVKRLPCAHIFHQTCIIQWLGNTCTCPVCRYELETSDAEYELERFYRMVDRKPRIHGYELERMTLSEIQTFFQQNAIRIPDLPEYSSSEQKEVLINIISESDKVDLIPESKPLRRALSEGTARMRSRHTAKEQVYHKKPENSIPQPPRPMDRGITWHAGQKMTQKYQGKHPNIMSCSPPRPSIATKRIASSRRGATEETTKEGMKTKAMSPSLGIKKKLSWPITKERRRNSGHHGQSGQQGNNTAQRRISFDKTTEPKTIPPRRVSLDHHNNQKQSFETKMSTQQRIPPPRRRRQKTLSCPAMGVENLQDNRQKEKTAVLPKRSTTTTTNRHGAQSFDKTTEPKIIPARRASLDHHNNQKQSFETKTSTQQRTPPPRRRLQKTLSCPIINPAKNEEGPWC